MNLKLGSVAVAAALICGGVSAASAQEQTAATDATFRATTLELSAYGEVKATPDTADITLGVQTQARTAADAAGQNAREMGRVMTAIRAAAVADRDIQTAGLHVEAQYAEGDNQPRRLTGYQASNTVTVTVHDLARLGAVLDASVAGGVNQVNGVELRLADPQAAEDAARTQAISRLQTKAELMARASGYRISRLVRLSDGGGEVRPMAQGYRSMAMRAPVATPVSAGDLTVRVDVSALYELTR